VGNKDKHGKEEEKKKKKKKAKRAPVTSPWDPYEGIADEQRPELEARGRAYARLFDVEDRLYQIWEQRSAGQTNWVGEALGDLVDEETNLRITAVGDKVAALGGHLELIAVFPDETVTLLTEQGLHTPDSDDTPPDDEGAEPG
jgi:hypothetical protein